MLFLPGAEEDDLVLGLDTASLREPVLCTAPTDSQEVCFETTHYFF